MRAPNHGMADRRQVWMNWKGRSTRCSRNRDSGRRPCKAVIGKVLDDSRRTSLSQHQHPTVEVDAKGEAVARRSRREISPETVTAQTGC